MTLTVNPKLIAIDNSILGKISKDFYSRNLSKQKKAISFLEKFKTNAFVPLFCYHHIAEIMQYENEKESQNRLSLISKFPQVSWIKSISGNLSIGSIIDIQGMEIKTILEHPNISLDKLATSVRKDLLCYSSGAEFIKMIEPEYHVIKELNFLDLQKSKAIDSISHIRSIEIDNTKLSVLKNSQLKTCEEVKDSFIEMSNHYNSEIKKRGDKKLENHDNVVSSFLESVFECGDKLYNQDEDSLYSSFVRAMDLKEEYVNENWTIGELGYFSIFVKKLEVISRTFFFNVDSVLQHPLSKYPSWYLWVELDKRIRNEKFASGSNIVDKYLSSLAIYSDLIIVDKRIKEYFRQIIGKNYKFGVLKSKVIKCSDYTTILNNMPNQTFNTDCIGSPRLAKKVSASRKNRKSKFIGSVSAAG